MNVLRRDIRRTGSNKGTREGWREREGRKRRINSRTLK